MALKKQRETRNLGRNRSKDREEVYGHLEQEFKLFKKLCSRGGGKGRVNNFENIHKGANPLKIRNFYLNNGAHINKNGYLVDTDNVKIKNPKNALQAACIKCDGAYRQARIKQSNKLYKGKTKEWIVKYYKKTYGRIAKCSECKQNKSPTKFNISRSMERGLHNICIPCQNKYSEAVGNRWIIYSPQGKNSIRKTKEDVKRYRTTNLAKDHIWPISKGGSDNKENIEYIPVRKNQRKSNNIKITNIQNINFNLISKRYHPILRQCLKNGESVREIGLKIEASVRKLIEKKEKMSDYKLKMFFEKEKKENNTKHNTERAVRKFRQYQNRFMKSSS